MQLMCLPPILLPKKDKKRHFFNFYQDFYKRALELFAFRTFIFMIFGALVFAIPAAQGGQENANQTAFGD